MTINGSPVETDAVFETDVRGAFQTRLRANRENIGDFTLAMSDGACIAEGAFTVPASQFPEAACEPDDNIPETGSERSDEYAALVEDAEPISYWRFEEDPQAPVQNEAGEEGDLHTPATQGQPGIVEGSRSLLLIEKFGPEGPDIGGWLGIPALELDEDFSIEAWVRFCGELVWFHDGLVGQADHGPDINFFEWAVHVRNGDSDILVADRQVPMAGWHHLVITRSGSHVTLYQDGEVAGSGEYDGTFPIKAIGYGNEGTFGGWVDEVAFYDSALTAEEVAAHAAFGE